MKSVFGVLFLLAVSAPAVFAESENDPGAEAVEANADIIETYPTPKSGQIVGGFELRPSFQHNNSKFTTMNTASMGYEFTPDTTLDYTQFFTTNISDPTGAVQDAGIKAADGFLRFKMKNIWQNVSKDLSLGYENRIYMPTDGDRRASGYVASMRNVFSLTKTITPRLSITAQDIPIIHAYTQAGSYTNNSANPLVENRFYLITSITITEKLKLSVPLLFNQVRNRAFAGAPNDDRWVFVVWTWPEITYALSPKTSMGLAFMSQNMIKDDFSEVNIGNGFSTGSTQFLLKQEI